MDGRDQVDVVVVGGGLAGLTCAVGLAESGLRVTVLEAAPALGGRASSWIDATTGDPVHIGPHIFLTRYPNFFSLLDRLGTRDRIVWQPGREFITVVDGAERIQLRSSDLPAPYHFLPSLLRDQQVSLGDLASNWPVVEAALEFSEERLAALDALDARRFLEQLGVAPRFIERFWAFTAMALLNVPLERCSAAALVRLYRYLIGDAQLGIGFPDGGLGDLYVPRAQRFLERLGSQVRTGARVVELTGAGDQVSGVLLAGGERIFAKQVVVALPPQALARLARSSWRAGVTPFDSLDRFQPVPYVSVFLWFDRRLSDLQFWARAYRPDDLNCDFYDLSNIHRGWTRRPSLITSNIIYSHRAAGLTDEEIVKRTIGELAEFLPEAGRARLRHAVVNRIPMAIHEPQPGTEALRPPQRTAVSGLVLAGDWTRTQLPSSMESAAASGWLAAEVVLADAGRPRALVAPLPELGGLAPALRHACRWLRCGRPFRAQGGSGPVGDRA